VWWGMSFLGVGVVMAGEPVVFVVVAVVGLA
jgi:hypothetical protein